MEILEKLPGITVERHLLLQGSFTSTDSDKMTAVGIPRQRLQQEPIRNRFLSTRSREAVISDETNRLKINKLGESRQRSFTVSQYHRASEKPDTKLELEVLGKNLQRNSPTMTSAKDFAALKQNNIGNSPNMQNPPPPPALKSILKRTGSGVSSRSCALLEVMSLDSGMCRLAASLTTHKAAKGISNINNGSTKINFKSTDAKENKNGNDKNSSKQNAQGACQFYKEPPQVVDGGSTTTSPAKSVSFKLDPEMQNREKERSLLGNRRGDARWGVVISPHQTRNKEKAARRLDFASSRKTEIKSNASKIFGQQKQPENFSEEAQRLNDRVNGNSLSIALMRHHVLKGKPSMNEIHQLSESYRKFLMNRALEQTPQFPKENPIKNTVTLKSYLTEVATGSMTQSNPTKRLKPSGLDKQYMSIPTAPYTAKSSFLPNVRSQN